MFLLIAGGLSLIIIFAVYYYLHKMRCRRELECPFCDDTSRPISSGQPTKEELKQGQLGNSEIVGQNSMRMLAEGVLQTSLLFNEPRVPIIDSRSRINKKEYADNGNSSIPQTFVQRRLTHKRKQLQEARIRSASSGELCDLQEYHDNTRDCERSFSDSELSENDFTQTLDSSILVPARISFVSGNAKYVHEGFYTTVYSSNQIDYNMGSEECTFDSELKFPEKIDTLTIPEFTETKNDDHVLPPYVDEESFLDNHTQRTTHRSGFVKDEDDFGSRTEWDIDLINEGNSYFRGKSPFSDGQYTTEPRAIRQILSKPSKEVVYPDDNEAQIQLLHLEVSDQSLSMATDHNDMGSSLPSEDVDILCLTDLSDYDLTVKDYSNEGNVQLHEYTVSDSSSDDSEESDTLEEQGMDSSDSDNLVMPGAIYISNDIDTTMSDSNQNIGQDIVHDCVPSPPIKIETEVIKEDVEDTSNPQMTIVTRYLFSDSNSSHDGDNSREKTTFQGAHLYSKSSAHFDIASDDNSENGPTGDAPEPQLTITEGVLGKRFQDDTEWQQDVEYSFKEHVELSPLKADTYCPQMDPPTRTGKEKIVSSSCSAENVETVATKGENVSAVKIVYEADEVTESPEPKDDTSSESEIVTDVSRTSRLLEEVVANKTIDPLSETECPSTDWTKEEFVRSPALSDSCESSSDIEAESNDDLLPDGLPVVHGVHIDYLVNKINYQQKPIKVRTRKVNIRLTLPRNEVMQEMSCDSEHLNSPITLETNTGEQLHIEEDAKNTPMMSDDSIQQSQTEKSISRENQLQMKWDRYMFVPRSSQFSHKPAHASVLDQEMYSSLPRTFPVKSKVSQRHSFSEPRETRDEKQQIDHAEKKLAPAKHSLKSHIRHLDHNTNTPSTEPLSDQSNSYDLRWKRYESMTPMTHSTASSRYSLAVEDSSRHIHFEKMDSDIGVYATLPKTSGREIVQMDHTTTQFGTWPKRHKKQKTTTGVGGRIFGLVQMDSTSTLLSPGSNTRLETGDRIFPFDSDSLIDQDAKVLHKRIHRRLERSSSPSYPDNDTMSEGTGPSLTGLDARTSHLGIAAWLLTDRRHLKKPKAYTLDALGDVERLYDGLHLEEEELLDRAQKIDSTIISHETSAFSTHMYRQNIGQEKGTPDTVNDDLAKRTWRPSSVPSFSLPRNYGESYLSKISTDPNPEGQATWHRSRSSEGKPYVDDMHLRRLRHLRSSGRGSADNVNTACVGVPYNKDKRLGYTESVVNPSEDDMAYRRIIKDPETSSQRVTNRPNLMGPPKKVDGYSGKRGDWWPHARAKYMREMKTREVDEIDANGELIL